MTKFSMFPLTLGLLLFAISGGVCENAKETWHFTRPDVEALHSKPADYRLSYGDDPLQFGELRLPAGPGPHPVAIVVHGGCWLSNYADIRNTAALADALRDSGIATWNIEYRREGNTGGGWPGTFEDVAHAADFIKTIANKHALDLNHVISIGHSAGGHLALWLAARHQLPPHSQLFMKKPLPLQGVIVLGGVPDLKAFRSQGKTICGMDVVGQLLGNSADQVEKHYKEASSKELLPLGLPQILIYGTEDEVVPVTFAKAYAKNAQQKGDSVKLVEVEGAAHQEFNVPNSIVWPTLKSAVFSLLDRKK